MASRRKSRKPFTIEDTKRHLSDLMWLLTHTIHKAPNPDLADITKSTHAFAQAASVLKTLHEADALEEIEAMREELREIREGVLRA